MSDLISRLSDIARRLPSRTGQRWLTLLAGRPSFAELEEAVHRLMGLGGREPLEQELQARADHDGAEQRPERCPTCGALVHGARRQSRSLESSVGTLTFARLVYRCRCGSFAPFDRSLGVAPGARLTPRQADLAERFGRDCGSFESGRDLLSELAETPRSPATLQQTVLRRGAELRVRQDQELETVRRDPRALAPLPHAATEADTVVIEADGGMVPCRDGYHEAKVGVVYRLGDRVEKPPPKGAPPDARGRATIRHSATTVWVGNAEHFGWLGYALAVRKGVRAARRVVVLGDGAEWIDTWQREFFPDAIRIVDLWHVLEHLATPARLAWGDDEARLRRWLRVQKNRLLAGRLDAVLKALGNLGRGRRVRGLAQALRECVGYLEKRRAQMDYPRYRELGLPIGSGLVEGRIKNLVKARTNLGGMRWTREGAQAVLSLRAHHATAA